LLDHRQQLLRVQARDHLVMAGDLAVMQQGDGTGFGGGIQGQQGGHRTGIQVQEKSGSINDNGPQAGRCRCASLDQLRAASTLAVIASTEPTPSMWLYFGLPLGGRQLLVEVHQRLGLAVVDRQAMTHGFFLVVVALDQVFTGDVVLAFHFRRVVLNVVGAARGQVHAATGHALTISSSSTAISTTASMSTPAATMASAWGMVRGKPSNRKPLAQSGWAMRSLTRLMIRSSETSRRHP
jgi:hypothetical protein